jgi:ankyrin repeat protein
LLLAQSGINFNKSDKYKCAPINYASENGHTEIVKLLLTHQELISINQIIMERHQLIVHHIKVIQR